MGMPRNRALALRDSAILEIDSIYRRAVFHGTEAAVIDAEYRKALEPLASGPAWARAYLDGYRKARVEELYARHLEWVRVAPGGVMWSGHKESSLPGARPMDSLYGRDKLPPELAGWKQWPAGHRWRTSAENPRRAGRLYFQAEPDGPGRPPWERHTTADVVRSMERQREGA